MNITMVAVEKLKEFITPGEIVRLAVEGGGCAGFQYRFGLQPEEDTYEDDYMIEREGIKLFVDSISYQYLANVSIDYEEDSFSSRFKINNPDTKGTCGCGSSFN
jgi:iron-sulfur cluster insertion protein